MVTDKNTKAEILDEYKKLLEEVNSLDITLPEKLTSLNLRDTKSSLLEGVADLRKIIEMEKNNAPVGEQIEIEEIISEKTDNDELEKKESKTTISKQSLNLEDELKLLNEDIKVKIEALNEATEVRVKEFQDLMTLEEQLTSFADKLNSDRMELIALRKYHSDSLNTEKLKMDSDKETVQKNYDEKISEAENRLKELKDTIEQKMHILADERLKENEAYEYDLSIKENHEDDQWQDRAAKKEALIKSMQEEIAILKEELSEKKKGLPELRKRLEELPALLENAKKEGADSCKKDMEEENAHVTKMLRREGEAAYQALELQLKNAKLDNEELLSEKEAIQAKLDKAYDESNKLYIQTVQSTGGIKILGGRDKD